jgi:hypothetical protein
MLSTRCLINRQRNTFTLAARDVQSAMRQLGLWEEDPLAFIERWRARKQEVKALTNGAVHFDASLLLALAFSST